MWGQQGPCGDSIHRSEHDVTIDVSVDSENGSAGVRTEPLIWVSELGFGGTAPLCPAEESKGAVFMGKVWKR